MSRKSMKTRAVNVVDYIDPKTKKFVDPETKKQYKIMSRRTGRGARFFWGTGDGVAKETPAAKKPRPVKRRVVKRTKRKK
jgi:hypothetical protein